VAKSVPDKVDIESAVISVTLVEQPIGKAVPEDMGVNVIWITTTELAALIVFEGLYVGFVSKVLDDVSDGAGRHLVGLS